MALRERLATIERLQRDIDDERAALLREQGWSQIDERGLRWRDPVQGDSVNASTAVFRVRQEVGA
jgi:hypothetical protein